MCDECQLGESVGWFEFMRISFGGKTDVNKMSDDEKTALLKALQANLQEKGCWTAEWLSASGVPCPPVREEELARLKEAKEELAETVRASETKKEELAALRIELDEMTKDAARSLWLYAKKNKNWRICTRGTIRFRSRAWRT